jgi:hypothetical protein
MSALLSDSRTLYVVVFIVGDSPLPFDAANMSASSTAPTEAIDLSVSMENTSQMTDESSGEVVEVPSPKAEDKHPLLRQKDITFANFDNTKGIFTVRQQQWTIHNAKKTASIHYIDLHLLHKICIHLKLKNQKGKSCQNLTDCLWGLANPTAFSTNLASTRPTTNYFCLANVVVNPKVKPTNMKMYGKGLTKDEQTEKKKTDQNLFTIMLKEYNSTTKYNNMLAKTSTAIPKALMPDQFDPLPEGEWQKLLKVMKKVNKKVEGKRRRIGDVSRKTTVTRTILLMNPTDCPRKTRRFHTSRTGSRSWRMNPTSSP